MWWPNTYTVNENCLENWLIEGSASNGKCIARAIAGALVIGPMVSTELRPIRFERLVIQSSDCVALDSYKNRLQLG